jgi:hypothetical protein
VVKALMWRVRIALRFELSRYGKRSGAAGNTRLGLPALVTENASKLSSPDASFGAIRFIACVNHIFYRRGCFAKNRANPSRRAAGACS